MIRHLLNVDVDVYRDEFASDGRGGQTRTTPDTPASTVRARVAQPSTEERAVAAQLGVVLEHVVHVPYSADVQRGDELDAGGPRRLRVQAVVNDSSRTYKRLECQVIEGA